MRSYLFLFCDWTPGLKSKSEVFATFKTYKEMSEKQTDKKIKILRSDNGREYLSDEFEKYLCEYGIRRQLIVPHTPLQNGVAERANRTLVEMARSMIVHSGLDESFWAEAVSTAAYLRNRATTKTLVDNTPYEEFVGRKPSVAHLRVFGSLAIALNKTISKKYRAKGKLMIMVGYSDMAKAYRLMDPDTRKVIVSRDVIFLEDKYIGSNETSHDIVEFDVGEILPDADEASSSNEIGEDEQSEYNVEVSSNKGSITYGRGRPRVVRSGNRGRPQKERHALNFTKNIDVKIPQSVNEALNDDYAKHWQASMQKEYDALVKNKTWSLVELPSNEKAINC
ncbi:uncharacterized protein LOC105228281 isoform X1 [Bactrocera dorsalis]|uniref:Uncharacterized protein LOC105228281 isoform X1 n=1 Tax=Bactrocera dorsalis TaxID=27457 RepID=A0ABM3IYB0_BACDO|nr:uncharacterized protein LOC105228281 isoform X1 [Bactrocera dorsalis]XP_049301970.1 uncharacterized protein LOC105228281 isoform X1 [Bactrocera dorsalis]XP_049301971.1 uncharacterized protein LOC105228281 isoform X1 [Bactrocera dorsalis]XP_049301972.1 uncharacterized protein LOC105228281 isoform X1 [Bactrocera dorsalis]XP_049301973.1 uncharacterized protein LOC105228281 isoform X1 [Bactrocera dorsalis]XP_049301974.1 uncharacterized protein LOC105228281 isoform X1 [Bactrocera dorsalis]XP_04